MPLAAYLLDLYDTLANGDWWSWTAELAELTELSADAIARGFHQTRMERNTGVYASAEDSLRHVLVAAGLTDPTPALMERALAAEAAFDEGVVLYDDALPTIAALRARGARLALVSNCSHTTRGIVDRLGFEDLFDVVVLSFELGVRKPDAAIYEAALEGVGAQPADALFVDDQTDYCDGARALGIDTRLIVRPATHPAEGFAHPNGHRVIASLGDLL
jgi:HAD superfamily hydrolase (TIGR01509 family)